MQTRGLNHLGLAVRNLDQTTRFFTDILGWEESGRDMGYPRTAVSDGQLRLTLWQVDEGLIPQAFNRRKNIGLHHLALEVESEAALGEIYRKLAEADGVEMEFAPEPVGDGPRKHMMCHEPGGIRIEFIWPGT
jgi:catechol 2,3-dioxygenase-like lactoylglutathione lyase family enzyme